MVKLRFGVGVSTWFVLSDVPRKRRKLGRRWRLDSMYSVSDYARECLVVGILLVYFEHCGDDYDATGGAREEEKEDGNSVWAILDYWVLNYIFLAGRNL